MMKSRLVQFGLLTALVVGASGCKELPGSNESQGAVIGGVSGAAVGAAVGGEQHRLLGALLGGAIGAGGGYLIGANIDKIKGKDTQAASQAMTNATVNPATPAQARKATTADINGDGFVTMDEVIAMKQAGLTDDQMLARLQATGQVFELNASQQQYLRDNGVSQKVIAGMATLNQTQRQQILNQTQTNSVISAPAPTPQ